VAPDHRRIEMQTKATADDHRAFRPTRTPGIYQRGSRYVVRFRDQDGKQRSQSYATMKEAKAAQDELRTDVRRGEYRADTKQTFREYAEEWKRTYQGRTGRGIREETLTEYHRDLDRAIAFLGRHRLASLTTKHIREFEGSLRKQGLKSGTRRRILAPLKACLAQAVEDGDLRTNPTAGVRLVVADQSNGEGDTAKAFTPEELARLVKQVGGGWHGLMVRLMAQTGIRIGEALGLRWQDVDTMTGRIHIRQRVRAASVNAPKSENGKREVPLSEALGRDLTAHWMESPFSKPEDLVFPTSTGKPQHATNLYRWFNPAAERAGVPWAGFHTLRHTAASRWLMSGQVTIAQVSRLLGHHDPGFTLRTYIHVTPADLPAGDALAEAVGVA
jgi:integrase